MFEVCDFHRLKGCFCEFIKHNRKVPFWKIPGMISVNLESNLLRSELWIIWVWAQGVNNGRPITING